MSYSLAYIASFVDCEGSIQLQLTRNNAASLRLVVHNTCLEAIEYINALLPGSITKVATKYNHKTCYRLGWNGEDAIFVLGLILPYLIIKKELANIAIDFWNTCGMSSSRSRKAISEAEAILRASYKEKIAKLNRRGVD